MSLLATTGRKRCLFKLMFGKKKMFCRRNLSPKILMRKSKKRKPNLISWSTHFWTEVLKKKLTLSKKTNSLKQKQTSIEESLILGEREAIGLNLCEIG